MPPGIFAPQCGEGHIYCPRAVRLLSSWLGHQLVCTVAQSRGGRCHIAVTRHFLSSIFPFQGPKRVRHVRGEHTHFKQAPMHLPTVIMCCMLFTFSTPSGRADSSIFAIHRDTTSLWGHKKTTQIRDTSCIIVLMMWRWIHKSRVSLDNVRTVFLCCVCSSHFNETVSFYPLTSSTNNQSVPILQS